MKESMYILQAHKVCLSLTLIAVRFSLISALKFHDTPYSSLQTP